MSEDQLLHGLELGRARPLQQLKQRRLHRADDRARALHPRQAALVVHLMARANRVGGNVHFDAPVEQVVNGLADTYVRLDPAHDRLAPAVEVEPVGADRREDRLLDPRLVLEPDLGGRVAEPLRILLADQRGQLQDARPLHQLRARARHPGEGRVGAKALLDVHHSQRGAVAGEQAHRAPASASARSRCAAAPAATVSSTRPRSRRPAKLQFSERLSQPCSPAIHSASRSSSATFARSPTATSGTGRPNSSAPALMRRTSSPNSSTPGSTSPVYRAANAVSSPVLPIGACSKGTSFSSRACGAWSLATQSSVPLRRPSISAWRSASVLSGGCIFMRVSIPRTSCSVSIRWCGETSALSLQPRAFPCSTASTEAAQLRCWKCTRASS